MIPQTQENDKSPNKDQGSDAEEIRRALDLYIEPGAVTELRIIDDRQGIRGGFFDDMDALTDYAASFSGSQTALYVVPNPIDRACLSLAEPNRIHQRLPANTGDAHILRRIWWLLDFDPIRMFGGKISSTDTEHKAAIDRAQACSRWLQEQGVPEPVISDSGNGCHCMVAVDMACNSETDTLIANATRAIADRFTDGSVKVDVGMGNRSRIWKLPGTLVMKGADSSERPHRMAWVLSGHARSEPCAIEVLERIAAVAKEHTAQQPHSSSGASLNGNGSQFDDMAAWLDKSGFEVIRTREETINGNHATAYFLDHCGINPEHGGMGEATAAKVLQFDDGKLGYKCYHDSCREMHWRDFRKAVDPTYGERLTSSDASHHNASHGVSAVSAYSLLGEVPLFPLETLPPTVRSYVSEGATAMDCPPDFIAVPLLALVAGGIGDQLTIKMHGSMRERAILWTVCVGEPGTAKSPALAYATEPVTRAQRVAKDLFDHEKSEYEFQKRRAAEESKAKKLLVVGEPPVLEHWYTSDATLEAVSQILGHPRSQTPGFTMVQDELVTWILSFDAYRNAGDKQQWMKLWAGLQIKSDRVSRDSYIVDHPTVSVTGGIQPEMLPLLKESVATRDGFLERALFSYPESHPMKLVDYEPSEETREALQDIIFRLRKDGFNGQVQLSPEASARFNVWHHDNVVIQEEAEGLQRGFAAKAPRQVGRICLILHTLACLDTPFPSSTSDSSLPKSTLPSSTPVSEATMAHAIALVEYFRAHSARVYEHFGIAAYQFDPVATRILRILEDAGGSATTNEIHNRLGRNVSAEKRSTALNKLVDVDLIWEEKIPPGPQGGRPTQTWHLVTRLYAETAETPCDTVRSNAAHDAPEPPPAEELDSRAACDPGPPSPSLVGTPHAWECDPDDLCDPDACTVAKCFGYDRVSDISHSWGCDPDNPCNPEDHCDPEDRYCIEQFWKVHPRSD